MRTELAQLKFCGAEDAYVIACAARVHPDKRCHSIAPVSEVRVVTFWRQTCLSTCRLGLALARLGQAAQPHHPEASDAGHT